MPREKSKTVSAPTKPPTENIEISKPQCDLLIKSWTLIMKHAPAALLKFEEWSGQSSHGNQELVEVLLSFAANTGTTLDLVRIFLEEEFKKNSQKDETNQNTIMRGSVLISKLLKRHLQIHGEQFLHDLLSKFLAEMIEAEDVSLEIDPLRIERGEKIEEHVELLVQRCKQLLAHIFGPCLAKMPPDIASIAAIFAEMAHHYAPDQIYVLTGGFLFLRFINPALLTPETHGLLPEGKTISMTCRRNLTLIAKLIQNISNMVEVVGKETYIHRLNDFVVENRWNMENFFKKVIAQKATTVTLNKHPALRPDQFNFYNNLLHPRMEQILNFSTPQGLPLLSDCLEKLSQFVHLDNFMSHKYTDKELPATLQISVTIDDQVFVQSIDSTVGFLQQFLKKNIDTLKKEEGKLSKKREKTKGKGPSALSASSEVPNTPVLFGKSVAEIMEQQRKAHPNLDVKIPLWLDEALHYLMLRGSFSQGIFRVSGDKNKCEELRKQVDAHKLVVWKSQDINDTTSIIKQFLREIPGQLLGDVSDNVISAANTPDPVEKVAKLKRALSPIPSASRNLLFRLMQLLWHLDASSYLHDMDARNLSIVFGPTILKFNPLQISSTNDAMCELIKLFPQIFEDDLRLFEKEHISAGPVWIHRIATPQSNKSIGFTASGEVWTSYSKALRIWDSQTGSPIRKIDIGNSNGSILCASTCGPHLICATDMVVQKWDLHAGLMLRTIKAGMVDVVEVDDMLWMASCTPKLVQIYTQDLELVGNITVPNDVLKMRLVGSLMWMGCRNGTILIYDTATSKLVHTLPKVHQTKINDFVETTNHVWSGGDDGILHIFKKDSFEEVTKVDTRAGKAKALGVFQNKVWVCTWEKSVSVYSCDTFKQVWEMKGEHDFDVSGIIHSWSKPRNCWVAWTASYDSTINWWKIPE